MKNYKQILEAVNRGIKFALSDLEDDEELSSISKQKTGQIVNNNSTKALLDLKKETVDLGLPSGTLWCKTNLGADCGNTPESWYGNYYAWGETEPSTTVDFKTKKCFPNCRWYNYKYANCNQSSWSNNDILTKYCIDPKYGYLHNTDDLSELLPEDDAAIQNIHIRNFKFHIPTKEQFNELLYNTTQTWETNYNSIEGLNGVKFTGINGNTLFIPAAGNCTDSNLYSDSKGVFVWTSSLNCENSLSAWIYSLFYYDKDKKLLKTYNRCFGLTIRPIINL